MQCAEGREGEQEKQQGDGGREMWPHCERIIVCGHHMQLIDECFTGPFVQEIPEPVNHASTGTAQNAASSSIKALHELRVSDTGSDSSESAAPCQ